MVASSQTCTAMFSALVVSLKENGLKAEDHTNDKDFDPDEKLVATYLRLRLELRTRPNIQKLNTENQPDNTPDYIEPVETVEDKLETGQMLNKDPTPGLEIDLEPTPQPDARSENGKPVFAKDLNTLKSNDDTTDMLETRHENKQLNSLVSLIKPDTPINVEDTDMPKKISGITKTRCKFSTPPERVSLSNAKAGMAYEYHIKGFTDLVIHNHAGSGLILGENGLVSAEDIQAGEYTIEMSGIKDERPVSIQARLSVIAHPKDLWTSITSDQIAPNAKPDEAFEKVAATAFMVAASKRGRSHAYHGTYRDDHFELSCNNGWHIMVVADGAGSARLSREGSRIACQVVLDKLKKNLPEKIDSKTQDMINKILKFEDEKELRSNTIGTPVTNSLIGAVKSAACKLKQYTKELNCNVTDLSTTLAIAIARKIENYWFLLSFSIGDGGIAVWNDKTNEVELMCRPDSGEFAGQTRFLSYDDLGSDTDCISRVFVEVRNDFSAFLAMTDGITDPKFETDSGLANPERWRDFWNDLTSKVDFSRNNNTLDKQFLDWMDFWSRGNHDDRTLAVLLPKDIDISKENESMKS